MKLFKLQNNKGITLVEVLIVIAIIVTMSSASFLGSRTMSNGPKLKMSAQKLASDLRKMQSFVLNLQEHNGVIPEGGWGIAFYFGEERHYRLFADVDDDDVFDDDGSEIYRDVQLPAGVTFSALLGDNVQIPAGRMIVSFQPPDPSITLCRSNNDNNCIGGPGYSEVKLELSNTSGSNRTVEINKFGLIDVQN